MAIASSFGTIMTLLTSNAGGAVQQLPPVTLVGGRVRVFIETVPLTGQAAGTTIAVARLPRGAAPLLFVFNGTVGLGTSTLSGGDANNPTLFFAASQFVGANGPQLAIASAAAGVPLNGPNYDSGTGALSQVYEDVILTIGAANLPAAGSLVVMTFYVID